MKIVTLALPALLMLATQVGAQPDWSAEARKSVVLVRGIDDQPATGFIVGWQQPALYLVTARHALYKQLPGEDPKVASKVSVILDGGVCGKPLEATVYRADLDTDSAILMAPVSGCEIGISRLRSLRLTSLTALNARGGTSLIALVRDSSDSIGPPVDFRLQQWEPRRLMMKPATLEEWSGAPLFTQDGEIVGILRGTESGAGYATDFIAVLKNPIFNGVPFNLAGRFSEVQLKGYPPGTWLTVTRQTINGDENSAIMLGDSPQRLPFPPGDVRLRLDANGYDGSEKLVTVPDPGSVVQCVRLVRPFDRFVAGSKWPLFGLTAALGTTTGIFAAVTSHAKDQFYDMPSSSGLDKANSDVNLTRGLLIGTAVSAALTVSAFALDSFALSPTRRSTIEDCP